MVNWGAYSFGVEIELIAEPHTIRSPLKHAVYYEKLAAVLRAYGEDAIADKLEERYAKHPGHYDKWWITKDGSLGNPDHPLIPLEAVSPILSTATDWEDTIDTFWRAWSRVFHMPDPSRRCGSHIHVSPWPKQKFSISELQAAALGVIHYEDHVWSLLPKYRRDNPYCRPNKEHSASLRKLVRRRTHPKEIWRQVKRIRDKEDIRNLMQRSDEPEKDRYVLWNFDNTLRGKSGTIEFRGGRGLRGPVRTKRWIAFVVSFIHFCLKQRFDTWDEDDFDVLDMNDFWRCIRSAAGVIGVEQHLPSCWKSMAEMPSLGEQSHEKLSGDVAALDIEDGTIPADTDSGYSNPSSDSDGDFHFEGDWERDFERGCVRFTSSTDPLGRHHFQKLSCGQWRY